jgi:hypothetical protein
VRLSDRCRGRRTGRGRCPLPRLPQSTNSRTPDIQGPGQSNGIPYRRAGPSFEPMTNPSQGASGCFSQCPGRTTGLRRGPLWPQAPGEGRELAVSVSFGKNRPHQGRVASMHQTGKVAAELSDWLARRRPYGVVAVVVVVVVVVGGGGADEVMYSMCEISLHSGPEPVLVTVTVAVPSPVTS